MTPSKPNHEAGREDRQSLILAGLTNEAGAQHGLAAGQPDSGPVNCPTVKLSDCGAMTSDVIAPATRSRVTMARHSTPRHTPRGFRQ